jgi:hypothetical protein
MRTEKNIKKEDNDTFLIKRYLAPVVPYITVGIGLLVVHNAWAAIIGYHLAMLLVLTKAKTGIPLKKLIISNNIKISWLAVSLGASGGILLFLLRPILGVPVDINIYLINIGLNAFTWPLFLAYHIMINPWIEEYYWRGYLGSNSKRLVVNDLLFAGYHIIVLAGKIDILWLVVCFICLFLGAWFWRQVTRWSQGLLSATMSHLAADFTIMLAIYFITRSGI